MIRPGSGSGNDDVAATPAAGGGTRWSVRRDPTGSDPAGSIPVWAALALLTAAVAGPRLPPPVTIGLLAAGGGLLFFRLSHRLSGDRRLVYVACGSYALRSAVALALFTVSANELPLLRSVQSGEGFWRFAPDAPGYHVHGMAALREGVCTGWILAGSAIDLFGGMVALLYWLFVPHPLVLVVFNVWAATGTALLAFAIARRVSGRDGAGIAAAALVGFWPSTLVWSSQLLREPSLLLVLFLLLWLLGRIGSLTPGRLVRPGVVMVGVAATVFVLAKSRPYAGWIMLGSVLAIAVWDFVRGRGRAVIVCGGIAMAFGVWAGISRPLWLPMVGLPFRPMGAASGFACGAPMQEKALVAAPSWLPRVSIRALAETRRGFALAGGTTVAEAGTDISTPGDLVRRLPATVAAALFAPYPWRWFAGSTTGAFRTLAGLEVVLLTTLLPVLIAGGVRAARTGDFGAELTLTYGLVIWLMVALVVVNEGTLFRLRLQGALPVLVVAIGGGGLRVYGEMARAVAQAIRTRSPA